MIYWCTSNVQWNSKLVPVHATKAQEERTPIILNRDTRWRWMINVTPRPLYPKERGPWRGKWAPESVRTVLGTKNLSLLPWIRRCLVACPVCSLVAIPTEYQAVRKAPSAKGNKNAVTVENVIQNTYTHIRTGCSFNVWLSTMKETLCMRVYMCVCMHARTCVCVCVCVYACVKTDLTKPHLNEKVFIHFSLMFHTSYTVIFRNKIKYCFNRII
jgi:hypothetical protein